MIKLTVNTSAYNFDKAAVIIGSGTSSHVDLPIPGENLQPVHVKIMEQEGRFLVINAANDPFATLNGAPFAKRTIKNGDIIQIGEISIRFEGSLTAPHREFWVQSEEQLQEVVEKAMMAKRETVHASPTHENERISAEEIDIEEELQRLAQLEEQESSDVETLLNQLQDNGPVNPELESPLVSSPEPVKPKQEIPVQPIVRASLKDFYLSDFDDEPKNDTKEIPPTQKEMQWNWKLIASLASALLLLGLLLALFFYFSMSVKNREEELKVAEGIADISMALTYAQFNHIQPRNQNWTDPEFLKNNLIAVLASEYSPITSLDMHGLFNNSSYILRIYNSSDLSHYVIIAQPAPSLSQWVLPREAIVVDSKAMELRKMTDLKALNRLLLNPNPLDGSLDGSGTNEVSELIKQGELMRLTSLASKLHKQGFNPPKALALLRPGAENLIYNAPRYHRFGEHFLRKAMQLVASGNNDEISSLQSEIESFSKYPDIVFYTSQGMQWAVHAQKILNSLMPDNKLLLAYIKMNSSGYVASSHLLMDEGRVEHKRAVTVKQEPIAIAEEPKQEVVKEDLLMEQLTALTEAHQKALLGVENELNLLLQDESRGEAIALLGRMEKLLQKHQYRDQPEKARKQIAATQFLDKLQQLVAHYDALQRDQRDDLVITLTRLYREHADMPLQQFMNYVKEAGL
jgi:hypothetical protein